jgi:hypothetical protein
MIPGQTKIEVIILTGMQCLVGSAKLSQDDSDIVHYGTVHIDMISPQ